MMKKNIKQMKHSTRERKTNPTRHLLCHKQARFEVGPIAWNWDEESRGLLKGLSVP